jgi:hypothetical protein
MAAMYYRSYWPGGHDQRTFHIFSALIWNFCTEFLFVLPLGCYTPLWFFPSFAKYELAYFRTLTLFRIAQYMEKSDCKIRRPCCPLHWSAATNWNYLLRRLILLQPKFSGVLLIFYWYPSELKMKIERAPHTQTHTHSNTSDTKAERSISYCVYSFEIACFTSYRTVCFGTLK